MVPSIVPLAPVMFVPVLLVHAFPRSDFTVLPFVLPLLGGLIGLLSTILLYNDISRGLGHQPSWRLKRAGLVLGVVCAIHGIGSVQPNWQPLFCFWIPPILGALLILMLSFLSTPVEEP
jgi:glycerol uptake facilitator-like aquaporin